MEEQVIVLGYTTTKKHLSERVIDPKGICFTLMAQCHGYAQGFIYEEDRNNQSGR